MGTGYTRNDVSNNIADGNIINASDLDGEFDAVESAFNSSTGHTHDGTAAEGGAITVVGPVQDLVVSATEVKPKTTNTLDLGTSALLYKDAYLQGNMYFRDTALKIVSSADGQLDIDADVELELVAPTVDIDASTAVTVDTASTTFTSTVFNVTGSANITGDLDVDNINIDGNTIISTDTNGAINITPNGTGAVNITATTNITGDLDVDNININGNTIISTDTNGDINISPDGTGTVVIDTDLDVDNININGNTISSTDTNGNINLVPNGTGEVNLTDNDKLTFGAGSDLQIYHDGSNSFVNDTGTGNLILRGANVSIQDASANNQVFINDGGAVDIRYAGSAKLTTTATGCDITGTVTADDLIVDDDTATITIKAFQPKLILDDDSAAGAGSDKLIIQSAAGQSDGDYEFVLNNDQTSSADRTAMEIKGNGDISFYNTSGNAKLFWDASAESLGIGSTFFSTTNRLVLAGYNTTNSDPQGAILFTDGGGNSDAAIRSYRGTTFTNGELAFETVSSGSLAEAMRIDSSGNVGIGTTSPSRLLSIDGGATSNGRIHFTNTATGAGSSNGFFIGQDNGDGKVSVWSFENEYMRFATNNTERMRITNGGIVLVGKTSTTNSIAGIELNNTGQLVATFASGTHLLGRNTTEGSILQFDKDGSNVGSIGVEGGKPYFSNSGNFAIRLDNNALLPANPNGTISNVAEDLGSASARWNNLYIGGGVYLGGTVAANKLDDYEEGTWTPTYTASTSNPTVTYDTQFGYYTKIGRLVTVYFGVGTDAVSGGSGNVRVSGLPFTVAQVSTYHSCVAWNFTGSNSVYNSDRPVFAFPVFNATYLFLWRADTNYITTSMLATGINKNRTYATVSYMTT